MRLVGAAVVAVALLGTAVPARAQVVTKVENGDTVVVEGLGKVRLLGIKHTDPSAFRLGGNTAPPARTGPETRPPNAVGGSVALKREKPARDLLRQLVLGRHVRIEHDPLVGDESGTRVYVFVGDVLVNAEMIRKGRARVDSSRAFAHQQEFRRLEKDAQAAGVGIWTTTARP